MTSTSDISEYIGVTPESDLIPCESRILKPKQRVSITFVDCSDKTICE
jgi:hypothetical protein